MRIHPGQFLSRIAAVSILALAGLVISSPVVAQTGGTASYLYDDNGRLHAVITPAGEAAVYNYDAAGNFTSITRYTTSTASVIDFTPRSGPVNTTVTIYGTGFSNTPSSNTVKFNGVTASVSSATATQLVVSVPTNATTGNISVTTPVGTASSSSPFTVTSSNVGFTGTINIPGTITVTISTPGTIGKVTFNLYGSDSPQLAALY